MVAHGQRGPLRSKLFPANVHRNGVAYAGNKQIRRAMSSMNHIVQQLQAQRNRAERELEKLNLALKALASIESGGSSAKITFRRKPRFSAAARARIAAAQRARWAKIKAAQKK